MCVCVCVCVCARVCVRACMHAHGHVHPPSHAQPSLRSGALLRPTGVRAAPARVCDEASFAAQAILTNMQVLGLEVTRVFEQQQEQLLFQHPVHIWALPGGKPPLFASNISLRGSCDEKEARLHILCAIAASISRAWHFEGMVCPPILTIPRLGMPCAHAASCMRA